MIYVQFVSDFTCPFCYVARTAFLKAVQEYDAEVEIDFLPYEQTPPEVPQEDTFHDPIKKQNYKKYLTKRCRELGLSAKLPPKVVPRPYTRLANEGSQFAEEFGMAGAYAQRILDAYYLEEQDIGRVDVLTKLAGEVGLDEAAFRESLVTGAFSRVVEQLEQDIIEDIQPKKIPTILIGEGIRLDGGAYSVEQYKKFLRQAEEEQIKLALEGAGCGDNGCGI